MFGPLNIFTYYIRNFWKILPVILILSFSTLGTTAAAALTNSVLAELEYQLALYKKYDTLIFSQDAVPTLTQKTLEEQLGKLGSLLEVHRGARQKIKGQSIVGNGYFYTYFLPFDDYIDFGGELNWTLAEGRFPDKNTNEIALSSRLMKAKNVKIGDEIGSDVERSEALVGRYKVVGWFREDKAIGALANQEYLFSQQKNSSPEITYFLKSKDGESDKLSKELYSLRDSYSGLVVDTKQSIEQEIAENGGALKQIAGAIIAVIVLVIVFSVGLLNVIFFNQRVKEFALLQGIGYTRKKLIIRTFFESLILIIISLILGLSLSQFVYTLLNNAIYSPRGIIGLDLFESDTFIYSLAAPVSVIIASLFTIIIQLGRTDPISILEARD